jgi:ribosome assembly protein YihI (activator of Der GTPase)
MIFRIKVTIETEHQAWIDSVDRVERIVANIGIEADNFKNALEQAKKLGFVEKELTTKESLEI